MLATMRSGAGNIFAKILLGLLVLSFAVWGIGDIFHANGRSVVAKVGGEPIPTNLFQQQLNREIQGFRRTLGAKYSEALVNEMRIPEQVLNRMIVRTLIQKEAASLRIRLDDPMAYRIIRNNPAFQDERGEFDKQLFQQSVDLLGMSEFEFISSIKREEASRLALAGLLTETPPPSLLLSRMREMESERRTAIILMLDGSHISIGADPTEEELSSYHSEHAAMFTSPEVRSFRYAVLDPTAFAVAENINEEGLERMVEERAAALSSTEKRTVEHLLFKTEREAKEAYQQLSEGKKFSELSRAENVENRGNISLGTLAEKDVPEGAGALVFALKEKNFSIPYETSFGWHIFYVPKIIASNKPDKAAIRAAAKEDLLRRKAEEQLPALVSALEDALAGGATLEEATRNARLALKSVGPVDKNGNTIDGKRITLPEALLAIAFSLGEKETSALTPGPDNSYYLVHVDNIAPAALRPLSDVRQEVTRQWISEQKSLVLKKRADEMQKALASGEKAEKVAVRFGASLVSLVLSRSTPPGTAFSEELLADIFSTPPGKATSVHSFGEMHHAGAVVVKSERGPLLSGSMAYASERQLTASYMNELLGQYVQYLRTRYPVSVDDKAFRSLTHIRE